MLRIGAMRFQELQTSRIGGKKRAGKSTFFHGALLRWEPCQTADRRAHQLGRSLAAAVLVCASCTHSITSVLRRGRRRSAASACKRLQQTRHAPQKAAPPPPRRTSERQPCQPAWRGSGSLISAWGRSQQQDVDRRRAHHRQRGCQPDWRPLCRPQPGGHLLRGQY
jgi:hypothetical protein